MGQIYDKKYSTCCNGQVEVGVDYQCCGGEKLYKDSSKECCKVKGGLVTFDTNIQGCCESAGKIFNKTIERCCGNQIQMTFNKNDKCCGGVKPYMDLVVDCCEAPVTLADDHYVSMIDI